MDNLRAFDDAAFGTDIEDEPRMETPPEIGFDERRMHVRAYNYWVSLLGGRSYPSIEDVDPASIDDFGPNSVLLDFTNGSKNPRIAFVGRDLREQCELPGGIHMIDKVPARSLLSRLTDHYLQIIANRAPIGFEAEFVSRLGINIMYRGILMPLSTDGETIDFIYGVINWKELADNATTSEISHQVDRTIAEQLAVPASPIWADGPHASHDEEAISYIPAAVGELDDTLELGVQHHYDEEFPRHGNGGADEKPDERCDDAAFLPGLLDADAGLADRLHSAREGADAVRSEDARSRTALYRALGLAYDFALAVEAEPEDYAELLEDAGIKAQARAPMTPVVKLIFGIDYDKTRLTEFAAALAYGRRRGLAEGQLQAFLEAFDGGLKAVVRAERRERRPGSPPAVQADKLETLRRASPLALLDLDAGDAEFVLLVARREADGRLAIVAPVQSDARLLDRAVRNIP